MYARCMLPVYVYISPDFEKTWNETGKGQFSDYMR